VALEATIREIEPLAVGGIARRRVLGPRRTRDANNREKD
jgi:hypothetical protein